MGQFVFAARGNQQTGFFMFHQGRNLSNSAGHHGQAGRHVFENFQRRKVKILNLRIGCHGDVQRRQNPGHVGTRDRAQPNYGLPNLFGLPGQPLFKLFPLRTVTDNLQYCLLVPGMHDCKRIQQNLDTMPGFEGSDKPNDNFFLVGRCLSLQEKTFRN